VHNWIEPKINWVVDDYINAEDLNRIENNTGKVQEILQSYGSYIEVMLKEDWSRTTIPYTQLTESILSNIKFLSSIHYPPPQLPTLKNDLNNANAQNMSDIERYLKILYDYLIEAAKQFQICGTFTCGQDFTYL
jgi:hypothetical protein